MSRDLESSRKKILARNPSESTDLEENMQKAFCEEESDHTHRRFLFQNLQNYLALPGNGMGPAEDQEFSCSKADLKDFCSCLTALFEHRARWKKCVVVGRSEKSGKQ